MKHVMIMACIWNNLAVSFYDGTFPGYRCRVERWISSYDSCECPWLDIGSKGNAFNQSCFWFRGQPWQRNKMSPLCANIAELIKCWIQVKNCARTMGSHLEVERTIMLLLPHLLEVEGTLTSLRWPSPFPPQRAAMLPFQMLVGPQPLPKPMATRQSLSQGHQLMIMRLRHCLLERAPRSWPARIGGNVVLGVWYCTPSMNYSSDIITYHIVPHETTIKRQDPKYPNII